MSRVSGLLAAAVLLLTAGACAAQAPPPRGLRIERVVLLMRHGVRPPTKAQPLPPGYARDPWPAWPVAPGELTPHGAQGVRLIAAWNRATLAAQGLLPARGCPAAGTVEVYADSDQRTIATGEAFAAAFAPGCGLPVGHQPQGVKDPLFSPGPMTAEEDAAARAAVAAKLGSPEALAVLARERFAGPLDTLSRVLACCAPPVCASACDLKALPGGIEFGRGDHPRLTGPLGVAASASESLMLEYAEGKPMSQVGWGRASAADVRAMLVFHPLDYTLTVRPLPVARHLAGPLALRILGALETSQGHGPTLTVLVGHDTNIAALGGLWDLHWRASGYPQDDPPPGGALMFAQARDASGRTWLEIGFIAQDLDGLRALAPVRADALKLIEPGPFGDAVRPRDFRPADFLAATAEMEARIRP